MGHMKNKEWPFKRKYFNCISLEKEKKINFESFVKEVTLMIILLCDVGIRYV